MIRLSIVVPALCDQQTLDQTLLSLLENRPAACEIIVACADAYVDPYDLDDEVRFVRGREAGNWPALANLGFSASRGHVVHLVEPGVLVEAGWTEPAMEILQFEEDVNAVSPFVLNTDAANHAAPITGVQWDALGRRREVQLTENATSIRSFQVLGPTRRAGFFRKTALNAVGGWDPGIGEDHADLELGCAFALIGGTCKVVPSCQVKTCHANETGNSSFAFGLNAQRLLRRYPQLRDNRSAMGALVQSAIRSKPTISYLLGRLLGCVVGAERKAAERTRLTTPSKDECDVRAA